MRFSLFLTFLFTLILNTQFVQAGYFPLEGANEKISKKFLSKVLNINDYLSLQFNGYTGTLDKKSRAHAAQLENEAIQFYQEHAHEIDLTYRNAQGENVLANGRYNVVQEIINNKKRLLTESEVRLVPIENGEFLILILNSDYAGMINEDDFEHLNTLTKCGTRTTPESLTLFFRSFSEKRKPKLSQEQIQTHLEISSFYIQPEQLTEIIPTYLEMGLDIASSIRSLIIELKETEVSSFRRKKIELLIERLSPLLLESHLNSSEMRL